MSAKLINVNKFAVARWKYFRSFYGKL